LKVLRYNVFNILSILSIIFLSCNSNKNYKKINYSFNDSIKSIDSINNLIKLDSLNADLFFSRSNFFIKYSNLSDAYKDLVISCRLDSFNSFYKFKLGSLYYLMGNSKKAKDTWELCANIDYTNIDCRLNLAELYLAVNDFKNGLKIINEILDYDSENFYALFLKGNFFLFNDDTTKAITLIQESLNLNNKFFEGFDLMGTIYSDLNNYLAIDYFNYACIIKPDRYDIFYKIGMFYQKMNNYDNAILNYLKSIKLNPSDKFSYHNIGVINIYKDNFEDAIENFSYAIDIDPTYNEAYFGRAYSYELSNKKLASETDYRTSLMINPSYRPSILGLERLSK